MLTCGCKSVCVCVSRSETEKRSNMPQTHSTSGCSSSAPAVPCTKCRHNRACALLTTQLVTGAGHWFTQFVVWHRTLSIIAVWDTFTLETMSKRKGTNNSIWIISVCSLFSEQQNKGYLLKWILTSLFRDMISFLLSEAQAPGSVYRTPASKPRTSWVAIDQPLPRSLWFSAYPGNLSGLEGNSVPVHPECFLFKSSL